MYSLRKTGSSLETMANTTSLASRWLRDRYSSNTPLRLRTSASVCSASLSLGARTGAGWTAASRNLPSQSSSTILARYLPSTKTRTRSSETRSTCLISATTPYVNRSSRPGSSVSIRFWATRKTLELLFIAHSMAAMLFSLPTSKWTRLFGKTTSPRRAMAGRWCVCRSTLMVTFSDIVNLPQPRPSLAGAAFHPQRGARRARPRLCIIAARGGGCNGSHCFCQQSGGSGSFPAAVSRGARGCCSPVFPARAAAPAG